MVGERWGKWDFWWKRYRGWVLLWVFRYGGLGCGNVGKVGKRLGVLGFVVGEGVI